MSGIGMGVSLLRPRKRNTPPKPMPIITRGLPAEESGNFYLPAYAIDADYSTIWRSVTPPSTTPQRIAVDISSVPNAQKTSTVLVWYSDYSTGTYYLTDAQTSVNYNAEPRDYTIQASTQAGGGSAPAIGHASWVTLVTVTANTKHSRQHALALSGYNWVQMRFTAANGQVGTSDDVTLQFDIHNVAAGNEDNWLFLGDSITAAGFARRNQTGAAWTNGPLATLIHTARPNQYPLMEDGGQPGDAIAFLDTNKVALLAGFTGKYVGIAMGTNDSNANTTDTAYYTSLLSIVDYVISLGKVAVVPKIPKRTDNGGVNNPNIILYNAKIDALYVARPTVIKGPDLYAKVEDGTIPLVDGVHPTSSGTPVGYEQLLNCWRDTLLSKVY